MEKIKILHLIKGLGRGGAEMLLPETLMLHDRENFEFHYIYFLPWKNQLVEAIAKNGVVVNCFAASNNVRIILQFTQLIKYVKANNIQIIHSHLPWAGIVGRLVFVLTKIPLLYTEHNKQERYHFLTRWMNRLTFSWQTAVVAVSKDVNDSIEKNITPRIPVHTIVNGVNTDFFQRDTTIKTSIKEQLKLPEDAIVVGTVAVFRFQKRLKEWLDVFSAVSAKHPNVYGIIVGDGPLREEIDKHRNDLGLKEKVKMVGLQTEVKPWYSTMDIFMMTSVFEGLPIALLEAMSMECAIVSTDAGGIKEVIESGKNGLIRAVDQWKMLSEDLSAIVSNEKQRKTLGQAARLRVKQNFGMEKMVKQLEELYSNYQRPVVGDRKPATSNL